MHRNPKHEKKNPSPLNNNTYIRQRVHVRVNDKHTKGAKGHSIDISDYSRKRVKRLKTRNINVIS